MPYVLGAVKPNVRKAADDAGTTFGIATIYGVGQRDGQSDHPKGLALDFMVPGDSAKGDQVANYFFSNVAKYNVHYIIWKQRIWNVERSADGWRNMKDRGGITANHYDHVHVSFYAGTTPGGTTTVPVGIPNPVSGLKSIEALLSWTADKHNWYRVALFILGGNLILLALILIMTGGQPVQAAAKIGSTVRKVSK